MSTFVGEKVKIKLLLESRYGCFDSFILLAEFLNYIQQKVGIRSSMTAGTLSRSNSFGTLISG
jgi:hypothetical protein